MSNVENKIIPSFIQFAAAGYSVVPHFTSKKTADNQIGLPIGWNHKTEEEFSSTNELQKVAVWTAMHAADLCSFGIHVNKDVFVVDVDCGVTKHGEESAEVAQKSLVHLMEDLDLRTPGMIVKTPTGGYHLYYKGLGVKLQHTVAAFPGIDLPHHVTGPTTAGDWVEGEYALISNEELFSDVSFSANAASVVNVSSLPDVSPKLRDWILKNMEDLDLTREVIEIEDKKESLEDEDLIAGEIPEVIADGARHSTLVRLIATWVHQGLTETNIRLLVDESSRRCVGGLPKSIENYYALVTSTLEKPSFSRITPRPLKHFLDNMIYLKESGRVFEIPKRKSYAMIGASYSQHHWYETPKEGSNRTPKKIYALNKWNEHPDRKIADRAGYKPCEELIIRDLIDGSKVANTYKAPKFKSVELGNVWEEFKKLVEHVGGSKSEFLMEWLAWQVQNPAKKLGVALALVSKTRGVGKNLLLTVLSKCVGMNNVTPMTLSRLLEKHNDYHRACHLVVVNETHKGMTKNLKLTAVNTFKELVTEATAYVNPKGVAQFQVASYVDYVITSNDIGSLPMEMRDRRMEVLKCVESLLSEEFYSMFFNLNDEELAEIATGLKSIKFNTLSQAYSARVADSEKQEALYESLTYHERTISEAIHEKRDIFAEDIITFDLFAYYVEREVASMKKEEVMALFETFMTSLPRLKEVNGYRGKRSAKVDLPAYQCSNFSTAGGTKSVNLYTCRNEELYTSRKLSDISDIRSRYNRNMEFVNGSRSERRPSDLQLVK